MGRIEALLSSVLFVVALTACLLFCHEAVGGVLLKPVVLSGQRVSDAGTLYINTDFGKPAFGVYEPLIDSSGRLAFASNVAWSELNRVGRKGVWSGSRDTFGVVALVRDAPPGVEAGPTYDRIQLLGMDSSGGVLFGAGLRGTGLNADRNSGLWAQAHDELQLVAREGDPAPGTEAGVLFRSVLVDAGTHITYAGGRVTFRGELRGAGVGQFNDFGIWSGAPGGLELVFRGGDPLPELGEGVTANSVWLPMANELGVLLFGVTDSNNHSAILTGSAGDLTVAVAHGDPVAQDPLGRVLTRFSGSTYGLNHRGQIAFMGYSERPELPSDSEEGIYLGADRAFVELARVGDPAPGAKEGVLFGRFSDGYPVYPIVNSRGDVLFRSWLNGPGVLNNSENEGFWLYTDDELRLIALEDAAAPGTDARFSSFLDDQVLPAMNSRGTIVFHSRLRGDGVDLSNDFGLWAYHRGVLDLILREGSAIDVDPTPGVDMRVIEQIGFKGGSGGEDGRPMSLTETDEIILALAFTDGSSGIFTAQVPEPSTLSLLFFGSTLMRARVITSCFGRGRMTA